MLWGELRKYLQDKRNDCLGLASAWRTDDHLGLAEGSQVDNTSLVLVQLGFCIWKDFRVQSTYQLLVDS